MNEPKSRQIVYQSRACGEIDTADILERSRHNNALDGVTGILWFDGDVFTQVLEGPDTSVASAFTRIAADARHHDVQILSDRIVGDREFGYWSMELGRSAASGDDAATKLKRRIEKLPADLQALFFA